MINTFLGAVFGGSILQQLGPAISSGNIWFLMGQAIPAASNFFASYILVHALFTNPFRFVWPHDGTVLFVFLRLGGFVRECCVLAPSRATRADLLKVHAVHGCMLLVLCSCALPRSPPTMERASWGLWGI